MISNEEIDLSKKSFRLMPADVKVILVEDTEGDNVSFRNVMNGSNKIIPSEDRSFILFDLSSIVAQYIRIRSLMPRVYPFYALKCMADKEVISLMGVLGAGFDCASWDEIKSASMALPKQPGSFPEKPHVLNSEKIIFSHPLKFENEMIAASKIGVKFTVFDTENELRLIAKCWPDAKLLMRIMPPRRYNAYAALGDKFGVEKSEMEKLISIAKELALSLVGVSFYVGSGVLDLDSWPECIEHSASVFRLMRKSKFKPYLLDIGGGFPGISAIESDEDKEKQNQFENMCNNVNLLLDKHFPASRGYVIISEPGTFFTNGSGFLFAQVIGKIKNDNEIDQVKIDGKIYPRTDVSYILNNSCFHSIEYDGIIDFHSLKDYKRKDKLISLESGYQSKEKFATRLLGYTVDEYDCIVHKTSYPDLSVGDWLVAPDKGAYSDVHNDLPTIFCSSTSIPHYYCISKKYLAILKDHIRNYSDVNNSILNSANRNDIINSITDSCSVM